MPCTLGPMNLGSQWESCLMRASWKHPSTTLLKSVVTVKAKRQSMKQIVSKRATDIFTREKVKDFRVIPRYRGGMNQGKVSRRRVHDVTYKGSFVQTCSTLKEAKEIIKTMVVHAHG